VLEASAVSVLVYGRSTAATVAAARAACPRVLIEVDDADATEGVRSHPPIGGALDYEQLVASNAPVSPLAHAGDDELLWLTGGTTGRPKLVRWKQATLLAWAFSGAYVDAAAPATPAAAGEAAAAARTARMAPVWLPATPLVHASGIHAANVALTLGGTVVLLDHDGVDGDVLAAAIEQERVTNLTIAGDVIARRLIQALDRADDLGRPYDVSSLRRVHSSGAPWSGASKDALLERGVDECIDAIGATEGVGFARSVASKPGEGSIARFWLGPHARVITEDGRDIAPGTGEEGLLAASRFIAEGYTADAAAAGRVFRVLGAERVAVPGDWARLEADGAVTFLGRGSECVNTGGEKVWTSEVETILREHPAVVDCVVLGVPDETWGQALVALVELGDVTDPSGDVATPTLEAWTRSRLAAYKCPRRFVPVDAIARTAAGKPDYKWARTRLEEDP
jgi:fatty-acyl-CoA synthase